MKHGVGEYTYANGDKYQVTHQCLLFVELIFRGTGKTIRNMAAENTSMLATEKSFLELGKRADSLGELS